MFVIEKQPIEETTFGVDFSAIREIVNGETIATVSVTLTTESNLPAPGILVHHAVVSNVVRIRVRGGQTGMRYLIKILITTNLTHVREVDVLLVVQER